MWDWKGEAEIGFYEIFPSLIWKLLSFASCLIPSNSNGRVYISSTKLGGLTTNPLEGCSVGKGTVCSYWSSDGGRLRSLPPPKKTPV